MIEPNFPYHYIAIEGNIGAGKTTLCNMIAEEYQCTPILEEFVDNPFLAHFYNDPERYAFPVELFFMTERYKQLQQQLAQQNLFQDTIIADYFFAKTSLFAQVNLSTEEFRLFQRLYGILNMQFKKPDLLVYLHRSVENLLENIKHRGRAFEQQIQSDYLRQIQNAYLNYLKSITNIPVLILYVEGIAFWENTEHYEAIVNVIKEKHLPRVHHINLFY
jgi:deoxyadenosine/deoxycytidine kinase